MEWLERHLAVFPAPTFLLVIGAGMGRELPVLTRFAKRRLVLLEPQPRFANALRRQAVEQPEMQVLENALDETSGLASLKVFNFPELSGLHSVDSLESLFPGARQTAELPVETRSLVDLVQQLQVPTSPDNWLIVDAPGLETAVLKGLGDPQVRACFGHVVLRMPRPADVEKRMGDQEQLEAFRALGFRAVGTPDLSDGDWPRIHLQYFAPSPERMALEGEVDSLRQRSEELTIAKTELQERLEQHTTERTELEAEVDALRQTSGELENARTELQGRLEQQAMEQDDRQSRFDDELREAYRDAEHRLTAMAADLDKARRALEGRNKEISETTRRHEEQCRQLEKELEQSRTDLSVALRVQALRDADLKELQQRYGEVTALKDRQHELLDQLGQRLGAASEYLKLLKGPDEGDTSDIGSGLAEALAGELEPGR